MVRNFSALKRDNLLANIDIVCAALLAICPLLQHYIGPLYNAAISALIIISVYLIVRMYKDFLTINFKKISFIFLMVVYQLYRIINHGTTLTEFGQSSVFIIFMFALAFGKINIRVILKVCRLVALIASGLLILQYITFYIFGFHTQLVVTSWLIPAADQWILGAQTGLAGVTGRIGTFYRPSAFFLEPAHVYIYFFPHIILTLFTEKITKKTITIAIILSLGVLLTTSGMGIAAVMGIWALFFAIRNENDGTFSFKNLFRKRNRIIIGILLLAFIVAIIAVPFLRRAVLRIFVPGKTGNTAISGRLRRAIGLIKTMTPLQFIFGVADNTHGIEFHIPGFLDALYRHGLIGLVLSYELYVKCILKSDLAYKFIGVVILITSLFSAHTHSTIGMLYFVIILFSAFQSEDNKLKGVTPYSENN